MRRAWLASFLIGCTAYASNIAPSTFTLTSGSSITSAQPPPPLITLVDHTIVQAANTNAHPLNCTGANFLYVGSVNAGFAITGVSDSTSANTWVSSPTQTGGGAAITSWYVGSATVSASQTVAVTGFSFGAVEFSCWASTLPSPFDQYNGVNNSNPTAQPGAVTPTQSGELILTAIGGLWNSVTIDSGFTILDQIAVGSNFALGVGYLIQGAAATVNPTWTMTGSAQQGGANIITFK